MHLMMSSKSPVSSTASPPLLDGRTVKKEAPDDEIKDFAETAMNELLGWYGYDARGGRGPGKGAPPGRSPPPQGTQPNTKSPTTEENDDCAWCNNPITPDSNPLNQSIGDKFCSEICFSQSRRATFKRAKTCDWCRHIRHTVSYVDFQDGATQLQFCSDKCLNQYKMHIFCRETQAHLDLNPHLINAATSNTNLITPDLWLKNCRSRSVSPSSDHSASPNAGKTSPEDIPTSPKINVTISPEITITNMIQSNAKPTHPLITVAPTSKLMRPKTTNLEDRVKMQTTPEMRREHRIMKTNSKRRRNSRCSSTVTSQSFQKHNSTAPTIKPQDLTLRSPTLSQEGSPNSTLLHNPQNVIPSPPISMNSRIPNLQPGNFPNPLLNLQPSTHINPGPNTMQNSRFLRPPFFPQNNFLPRPPVYGPEQIRNPIPPSFQQLGIGPPPPLTVLVPYPVILPVPLPIPIPIPIMDFVKAYECTKWSAPDRPESKMNLEETNLEEPLDFTMNAKRKNIDDKIAETVEVKEKENCEKENTEDLEEREDEDANTSIKSLNREFSSHLETVDSANPEQTLPRFKITRLGAKMSKIVIPKTKEISESTRPLRKRRRLVEVSTEDECSTVVNKSRKPVHA